MTRKIILAVMFGILFSIALVMSYGQGYAHGRRDEWLYEGKLAKSAAGYIYHKLKDKK